MVPRIGVRLASRPSSRTSPPTVRVEQEEGHLGPLLAGLGPALGEPYVERPWVAPSARTPRSEVDAAATSASDPRPARARAHEPRVGPRDPTSGDVPGHAHSVRRHVHRVAILWPMDDDRAPVRRAEHDQPAPRGPREGARARPSGPPSPIRRTDSCIRWTSPWPSGSTPRSWRRWPRSARRSTGSRPSSPVRTSSIRSIPLLVTDRGAIPLRPGQAESSRGAERPRSVDAVARDPDRRSDRRPRHHRGRGHVLAATGPALHRAHVADERGRARAQLAALVGGDVRVFDVPYWRGPGRADPSAVGHLAGRGRSRRRLPAAPAGRPVAAARGARDPADRGAGRGVPDARLQRAGGPSRASSSWPRGTR